LRAFEVIVRHWSREATYQELTRFSFDGFIGSELSVHVWFIARSTRMQLALLTHSGTTRRARFCGYLFGREVFSSHSSKMHHVTHC